MPNANVSEIARRAGIPKGTLFSWVEQAKVGSMSSQSKKKRGRPRKSSRRSPEEKLRLLTETTGLSDDDVLASVIDGHDAIIVNDTRFP